MSPTVLRVLALAMLVLAGCSPVGLQASHTKLWFSPELREASVTLQNAGDDTVRIESVRIEGDDWDRFTIRSDAVSASLDSGDSLIVAIEAEPRALDRDGYVHYATSEGYLLVAHDGSFSKIPMHIQPAPPPLPAAGRLVAWLWTVLLLVGGMAVGGVAPIQRWVDFDRATRAAWVMLLMGLGLGGFRYGLCTTSWADAITIGDSQQCARGLAGIPSTLLPPTMACVLGVIALVWLAALSRSTKRSTALPLAAGVFTFAWLVPPMMVAAQVFEASGPPASQPFVVGFASIFWVVGIAGMTRWIHRDSTAGFVA